MNGAGKDQQANDNLPNFNHKRSNCNISNVGLISKDIRQFLLFIHNEIIPCNIPPVTIFFNFLLSSGLTLYKCVFEAIDHEANWLCPGDGSRIRDPELRRTQHKARGNKHARINKSETRPVWA
ncbi:hypothetical protein ACTXT7_002992 [Hymenolepis weldensis]